MPHFTAEIDCILTSREIAEDLVDVILAADYCDGDGISIMDRDHVLAKFEECPDHLALTIWGETDFPLLDLKLSCRKHGLRYRILSRQDETSTPTHVMAWKPGMERERSAILDEVGSPMISANELWEAASRDHTAVLRLLETHMAETLTGEPLAFRVAPELLTEMRLDTFNAWRPTSPTRQDMRG
jgi:hypothetical protein